MKLVSLDSYVATLPTDEPIMFGNDSIVVEDENVAYLVGNAAAKEAPNSARRFGGNLNEPQYRTLLKALVAATLGEGDHEITIALSAAKDNVANFRDKPGEQMLSGVPLNILKETIAEIKFKTKKSDSKWKLCRVTVKNNDAKIFYECQAVSMVIPTQLKSFVLWQLGHGDLQQSVMVDSRPMPTAHMRSEGISAAIRSFRNKLGLSLADADESWRNNSMPERGGMNGKTTDCTIEKKEALRAHFRKVTGQLLNENDSYKDRAKNVILSGGGAKDPLVVEVIREEVESGGHYKFHLINELPIKDERCDDAKFTCVHGLLTQAQLALDIGNSLLKGGLQ